MKKIILKFIMSCLLLLNIAPIFNQASAVRLLLPKATRQEDVNIPQTQLNGGESNIFRYIRVVNKYLWFIIIGVAMFGLIYAGLMFITSSGDKTKVSGARDIALISIIAIVISMISYMVVNLIINLF